MDVHRTNLPQICVILTVIVIQTGTQKRITLPFDNMGLLACLCRRQCSSHCLGAGRLPLRGASARTAGVSCKGGVRIINFFV